MSNIFDPEFSAKFENLQSGDLSESMKWWTPEDRKKFYEMLIGVLQNMSHSKNESNPQNREIVEQMTARLLAEIITIAMRNKDQRVAEMLTELTGLKLSLQIDKNVWDKPDAGEDLKRLCEKQLQNIEAFRAGAKDLKSGGSDNPIANQVKDIFKNS